jgi:hypothetical protein
MFGNHSYGVRRTYLSAYATALTILQVYFNRNGLGDNRLGAVKPALKTGGFILPGGSTLLVVYHRSGVSPVAGYTGFADTW